tara:strand:- start:413 stop:979 length:567 start_codon:yes stop_codon:yes gene_type:complete
MFSWPLRAIFNYVVHKFGKPLTQMKYSELIRHQSNLLLIAIVLICCFSCKQKSKDKFSRTDTVNTSFAAYNHTAFVVKNLDSSIAFYNYVFEFDTIHYPFPYRENIRAKWMSIGNGGELHLGEFKGDTTEYYYPGHIGFTVSSIDTILSRLKELKHELPEMENMPNGERTIHIADIDGNNIHIIERKQ